MYVVVGVLVCVCGGGCVSVCMWCEGVGRCVCCFIDVRGSQCVCNVGVLTGVYVVWCGRVLTSVYMVWSLGGCMWWRLWGFQCVYVVVGMDVSVCVRGGGCGGISVCLWCGGVECQWVYVVWMCGGVNVWRWW